MYCTRFSTTTGFTTILLVFGDDRWFHWCNQRLFGRIVQAPALREVVAILRVGHINVSKTNWIDRFVYS